MDYTEFNSMLVQDLPPKHLSLALQALWYDAKGDWERAHDLAQEKTNEFGDWIHAYLHRKEGDLPNASYWYRRAGKSMPSVTLNEEWEIILREVLS